MKKLSFEPRLIAVEGAIGAGKTSLSKLMCERSDAKLVLENDKDNPFLGQFYENRDRFGFQTQVFFLLSRYQQYSNLAQRDLFDSVVIVDYLFQRDRIFAHLNLKGQELALYEKIYNLVEKKIPKPELVIYLQASTEVLKNRVKKRARPYEKNLDIQYLEKVSQTFNDFFFHYTDTPLLVINTNDIDFVEKKCDLEELINKINHHRIGREYYNPLGS